MAETHSQNTPQLGTGIAPVRGGGDTRGEVTSGDQDAPTPRLASSDIRLFKSLYLLQQVDTLLFLHKNIR